MGKKKYDLICSLGGNCSAANNLKFRKLRTFSLPFDWTYILNDKPIYKLVEGLKDNFENFFKKENLEELKGEEYNPNHREHLQYKDNFTGYYYVNHFLKDFEKEYDIVYKTQKKRFARFIQAIEKSKKCLFILSTSFYIKEDSLLELLNYLKEAYPKKEFNIVLISFNCEKDENIKTDNLEIRRYRRNWNLYDFNKTNFEWNFLDDVKINRNFMLNPIFRFLKIKKGCKVEILPVLPSIFGINLYFLGLKLNFSLGKIREE